MIAAHIRRRIDDGELKPGDRVPSIRKIEVEWQVAHATATKALSILRAEGLVEGIAGSGTVVAGGPGDRAARGNPRERIVRAAIEIADAEGLDAVSMRAIADRLHGAAMSIYHHVKGRSDLVVLMAETALAGVVPVDDAPRGRSRLESAAQSLWRAYRRHPWLARLGLDALRSVSPMVEYKEYVKRELIGRGADPVAVFRYHLLLHGLVRGLVANLFGEESASGASWWFDGEEKDLGNEADEIFALGLRGLLDGLASGRVNKAKGRETR